MKLEIAAGKHLLFINNLPAQIQLRYPASGKHVNEKHQTPAFAMQRLVFIYQKCATYKWKN
ncbi:hypothetical protein CHU_0431 [Cytophaga hutchinsonii ATCC 33406]|uniref:Uncharacterized protein n=1 Tax=Cytophaga hutchinsonii (strain ATCC 33406 / DSM 1761 / CIP 103989 / NBRC 15051 / NCIMB 9469 / D465) TaxID=269798 RepID=A0A6N4SN76_CYTH3|nr:hypothetical protein CHU_0431 [Cytophaga hutchinsonii ATCC 33406]